MGSCLFIDSLVLGRYIFHWIFCEENPKNTIYIWSALTRNVDGCEIVYPKSKVARSCSQDVVLAGAVFSFSATANPEGGDYSVTPMDDSMLTRMLHTTLKFDPKTWAEWASSSGVDPRGIAFVLTYPEVVTGKRTTPRSLPPPKLQQPGTVCACASR